MLERVRELHAEGLTDSAIRDAMPGAFPAGGAGRNAVNNVRARRLGLPTNPALRRASPVRWRWPAGVRERVLELHAAGRCAREIAAAMPDVFPPPPRGQTTVLGALRRLGLRANPNPEYEAYRTEFMRSLGGSRRRADEVRGFAERWGLPTDLSIRQVQLVLALTAGPMTERAVYEACGVPADGVNMPRIRRGGRSVVALKGLCERGLVVRVGGRTKRAVYLLTEATLGAIRAAAERQAEVSA